MMCDICAAEGYEIEDGCPVCGITGHVGVYLDGSGCWKCSPRADEPVDGEAVLGAWARSMGAR